MPSDGTIGGLVGKLDVLRVECPSCGRHSAISTLVKRAALFAAAAGFTPAGIGSR
jgi:hypothetical protein